MDSSNIKRMIEGHLEQLGRKYGFSVSSHIDTEGSDSMILMLLIEDALPEDIDKDAPLPSVNDVGKREEFASLCKNYGFEPEDYGKSFCFGGNTYKITGFKPRNYVSPLIAVRTSGRKSYNNFKWGTPIGSRKGRVVTVLREMLFG